MRQPKKEKQPLSKEKIELNRNIAQVSGVQSQSRDLEAIINRSPAVVFLWRKAQGWPVDYVSDNVSQFGYTTEEFISGDLNYVKILYSDDRKRVEEEISRYVGEGLDEFTQEYRIVTKSGKIRWIEDKTKVRRNPEGIITHHEGIITDITERRKRDEELNLRAYLLDNASDSIILHTVEGDFVYVNEAACQTLGYNKIDLLKMNIQQVTGMENSKLFMSRIEEVLEKGSTSFEAIDVLKDGSCRYKDVGSRLVETGGRKLILNVAHDITERRKAEEELKLNAGILASTSDSILVHGLDGAMVYVNETAYKSLGYTREELMSKNIRQIDVGSAEQPRTKQNELMEKGSLVFETTHLHANGNHIPVEVNGKIIESGGKKLILGVCRDIAERKQAEEELKMRSQLLDSATDSIIVHDLAGHILYVNEATSLITGYTREEMLKMNFDQLHVKSPSAYESKEQEILQKISEKGTFIFETTDIRKDGSLVPVEVHDRIIESQGKKLIIGVIRDITERKKMEEYVNQLAYHDPLTGLPNRTLLNDRFNLAQAHAERYKHMLGFLLMDLDKFKEINDSLGHSVGDKVLKEIGRRMVDCIRKTDTVARMGGDEYVVLLAETHSEDDTTGVAKKILEEVKKPLIIDDQEITVTTSIGIALYPRDGNNIDILFKRADSAMYLVKQLGRNGYRYYTQGIEG